MKRVILAFTTFTALSLVHVSAYAMVSSCSDAQDGTPCGGGCVISGVCSNHQCVVGSLASDGTPCASENHCTSGDTCQAGVCIAGSGTVVCPNLSDCAVGACVPSVGCTIVDSCTPPDLGGGGGDTPDMAQPADLAMTGTSPTNPTDTGPTTTVTPTNPMHPTPPTHTRTQSPDLGDSSSNVVPPSSAPVQTPDMSEPSPGVVQGSNLLTGCTMTQAGSPGSLSVALLLFAIAISRRKLAARARR